jgi:hypothetical protein
MGMGVRMRKWRNAGVNASKFDASEKNAKTSSSGLATSLALESW